MDKIQFIDPDSDATLNDLVTDYESLSGKVLQPAQAEQLLLQAAANRITLLKIGINETANQNFVEFAGGAALDYLGVLVGVTRLASAPATCLLEFTLVDGHGDLSIPSGIRVQSIDGQVVFITTETKNVLSTDETVAIKAACTTEGKSGNDYAAGNVSVILDPQAYVSDVANMATTAGGSDPETDDEMRERIKLAPSQFSVAGPDGAYKFFAKSAHPLIIDVEVKSLNPGDVNIYILLLNGDDPTTEIIDAVFAACSVDKVRPLTDTVYVDGATKVEYDIEIELTLLDTAVESQVLEMVNANITAFKNYRKSKLGVDVIRTQLYKFCMVDGVYDANIVSPASNIEVDKSEFTEATTTVITVTGTHAE